MEIPDDATRGTFYSYKEDKTRSFVMYPRENDDTIIPIKWDTPCFYSLSLEGGDYMSRYNNFEGVLTKRKNGKWMFKGHQKIYAHEEVKFY